MNPRKIVVLGGSGFVGRHVVNRLVAAGHRVVVPTRRREAAKHLILLPTVDVVEADIHDARVLGRLLAGADAVVNLIGILNQERPGGFRVAHSELAAKLVQACRDNAVQRLVQMSSLNADADGPSEYLRTKGQAEGIVAESGLAWTILRPSVIFGPEDSLTNTFACLMRWFPVVFLASPNARFQPVYVGDVATAVVGCLDNPATIRQRYPLCGPGTVSLRELVTLVGRVSGHERPVIGLGRLASRLQASFLERLPGRLLTRDNLDSMERDSVSDVPFPAVFGVVPASLEAVLPGYLGPAHDRDRYAEMRVHSGR